MLGIRCITDMKTENGMKRISLDDLEHALHPQDYQQLYEAVLHRIEQER